jgi:Cu2+-exporting ATPase
MPCTLCDLPTPDPPVSDDDVDGTFCCRGCLEVARTLGDAGDAASDIDGPEDVRSALGDDGEDSDPDHTDAAFVAVDGMHCATCEAFLEARATENEGVVTAEASASSTTRRRSRSATCPNCSTAPDTAPAPSTPRARTIRPRRLAVSSSAASSA